MSTSKEEPKSAAQSPMDDDRMTQKMDMRLARRLWTYIAPYKRQAIASVLISLLVSGFRLGQPMLIHNLIENDVARGDFNGIALKAGALFGLITLVFICDVSFEYITGVVGQKSMHDLRMALFRHVARLDVGFFDRNPVGRLVTRMTSDVSTLNDLFSSGVISMFAEMLMILGILAMMLFYSARLTLVVLCAVPLFLLVIALFRQHARKWYLEARGRLAKMNSFLQENIAGMRTVQAFNREARNHAIFRELNDEHRFAQVQTIFGFALFYPALNLVSNLTLAAVIWFGGRKVLEARSLGGGEMVSFATLFLFVQSLNMILTPLRNLSEKYNLLLSAMASSSRIFKLLDTPAMIDDARPGETRAVIPTRLKEGIAFESVRFEYIPGEPVLHDISFSILPGQTVAVVGATGSGKTTLINLLTRFYDVTGGRITLDGTDLRAFDPHELRRLFAIVLQEVFLFSGTVASNIRLANPGLTDEQIQDLLTQVRADDFVRELPGGLDARVHERGATFSTGQKQLLAFARALAADPQILILDEATANVDTATEHRIQEAIGRLLQGRTALVIAHRISTIQKADRIIVMHKGCIRETGTHEELLRQDGIYRRLYELQYRSEAVETSPAVEEAVS